MAEQIRRSAGPSGTNMEYLRELAAALRELGIDDPHVFGLERLALASAEPVDVVVPYPARSGNAST